MSSIMKRYIHEDGSFRAAIVDSTAIGRQLFEEFQPSPIGLQLMTQAVTAAFLLSSSLKTKGRFTMDVIGDGPLNSLSAEVDTEGDCRVLASDPHVHFDPNPEQGLFEQALGSGQMRIRFRAEGSKQDYTGIVELEKGELALNAARYLLQSEQIHSAVNLGAELHPNLGVSGSGGILIQGLPGGEPDVLSTLEQRVSNLPAMGALFAEHDGHIRTQKILFDGFKVKEVLSLSLRYFCGCSKPQMMQKLGTLPVVELEQLRDEHDSLNLDCSYCHKSYVCESSEVDALIRAKENA